MFFKKIFIFIIVFLGYSEDAAIFALRNKKSVPLALRWLQSNKCDDFDVQHIENSDCESKDTFQGDIQFLDCEKAYGFISFQNKNIFFHFSDKVNQNEVFNISDVVTFSLGENRIPGKNMGRSCAKNVKLSNSINLVNSQSRDQFKRTGEIVEKREKHGFVKDDLNVREYIFYSNDCVDYNIFRVGQKVLFFVQINNVDGINVKKAVQLSELATNRKMEAPRYRTLNSSSLPSAPESSLRADLSQDHFFQHDVYPHDESRSVEFKALTKTKNVCSRIIETAEKYLVAFLNSEGGRILFGILDNGIIAGLRLNRKMRDEIRVDVDQMVMNIHPPITNDQYSLNFVPVRNRVYSLFDYYVVSIVCKKGDDVYSDSKHNAWMRKDGSVRLMNVPMAKVMWDKRRKGNSLIDEENTQKLHRLISDAVSNELKKVVGAKSFPVRSKGNSSFNPIQIIDSEEEDLLSFDNFLDPKIDQNRQKVDQNRQKMENLAKNDQKNEEMNLIDLCEMKKIDCLESKKENIFESRLIERLHSKGFSLSAIFKVFYQLHEEGHKNLETVSFQFIQNRLFSLKNDQNSSKNDQKIHFFDDEKTDKNLSKNDEKSPEKGEKIDFLDEEGMEDEMEEEWSEEEKQMLEEEDNLLIEDGLTKSVENAIESVMENVMSKEEKCDQEEPVYFDFSGDFNLFEKMGEIDQKKEEEIDQKKEENDQNWKKFDNFFGYVDEMTKVKDRIKEEKVQPNANEKMEGKERKVHDLNELVFPILAKLLKKHDSFYDVLKFFLRYSEEVTPPGSTSEASYNTNKANGHYQSLLRFELNRTEHVFFVKGCDDVIMAQEKVTKKALCELEDKGLLYVYDENESFDGGLDVNENLKEDCLNCGLLIPKSVIDHHRRYCAIFIEQQKQMLHNLMTKKNN